ncbi:MAG TPA: ATP-dependent DNA ligase [Patescibacteria group bacterium]|nr:ATP-dependent DNA ligase [Patescibacteria group bacterium]
MKFSEFATYLDKLEETSSRLSLIDILSELFKSIHQDEIDKVIYLIQGRVAPFFAPVEIGMADKMVAQSVALAFNLSKEDVLRDYDKKGDLGLVAFELAKDRPNKAKQKELSVGEVFERLTAIANTSGDGSVEKKIGQLRELLERMDATSAKHLVRVPLGNTRLGIGDPTVLDGLAQAKLGDKSKRKLLEGAYNRTSDLGLIGQTLFESGLSAVEKLSVKVGNPIRSELCERLPTPQKVIEKMGRVDAQYKYDGFRVQIHKDGSKVSMFSRNLENMTHMFPELIEGTLRQVKAKTAILDSEALAYQAESEEFLPFQETTKRRRKHNIDEVAKQLPLKAFVFDILYSNGKSLLETPLEQRLAILQQTVEKDDTLIPAVNQVIEDPAKLQMMLDESISKGLEGVVVKRLESPYEAGGRNFNWVKLKRHSNGELKDTIDCVILGYIYGKGKRTEFGAGSLLVGVYDPKADEFVTVTKIGTGLTDEEWREIHKRADKLKIDHKPARVNSLITPSVWVKPEIVIEILADEITRSPIHTAGMEIKDHAKGVGYALRFPRLVRFREADRKAEDATTVKELVEMFEDQGKK